MKATDSQTIVVFNYASLSLGLKVRVVTIVILPVLALPILIDLIFNAACGYWHLALPAFLLMLLEYHFIRGYIYWNNVLEDSTPLPTTKKTA